MTTREDYLPAFNDVVSVGETNAMIDRFELEFGDFPICGDDDDILFVLNYLDQVTIPTASNGEVKLFNAANNTDLSRKVEVQFARRGTGGGFFRPSPIISGILRKAGRRGGAGVTPRARGERVRLSFQTSLNLARFVQAQSFPVVRKPANARMSEPLVLAVHPQHDWFEKEQPLLPAENLIIGSALKYGFVLRQPLRSIFRTYIDGVRATLYAILSDGMALRETRVESQPYYSLQSLEVYWEFSDNDPIGLVESLVRPLHRVSHYVSVTRELVESYREETNCESKCITLNLTANSRLRVYAKTTQRVRFEVEFNRREIGTLCEGQTARTADGIEAKAQRLIDTAVSEMNFVLGELRRDVPAGVRQQTPVGLISKIVCTLDNPATSQAVVASLHSFGRLAPEGNPTFLAAAHELKKARVLRTLGRQSIYVVTDEYEAALRGLMNL